MEKVVLHETRTEILLPLHAEKDVLRILTGDEAVQRDENDRSIRWAIPTRWTGKARLKMWNSDAAHPDAELIDALRKAHAMLEHDRQARPTVNALPPSRYERRILRLAFLAPDIQQSILDGRQPPRLTLEMLIRTPPSHDWDEQRRMLARL